MTLRASMMTRAIAAGALMVMVAAAPEKAAAQDMTVGVNSGAPTLLSNGGLLTGTFDINGALPDALFQQPYDVVSASITFRFHDDGDPYQAVSSSYNGQTQQWWGDGYNYYSHFTVNHLDPQETAHVTAGANSGSASSSLVQSNAYGGQTDVFSHSFQAQECGWGCNNITNYVYSRTSNYYSAYAGGFSLTQALNLGSLTDLATDGLLNWSINATGDFIFDGATLTATVSPSGPAPVPEPASLLLLGSGLTGLAWRARQRRRAASSI